MVPMQDAPPRVGYSDLLVMPDDGRRYEIHGGELVVVPSPLLRHQIAAMELVTLLNDYRRVSGGLAVTAPFDIVFDEYDVVQPDVVFFRAERLHLLDPNAVTRAAPDIVVEVLSPSTAAIDRGRKMRMFARYGVPEVLDRRPAPASGSKSTSWRMAPINWSRQRGGTIPSGRSCSPT